MAGTGWLLFKRSYLRRGIILGLAGMVVLPLLHYWAMGFEIGSTVKGTVGGQMHEVDWIYQPEYGAYPQVLSVVVSFPGYRPMHRDNTWSDLRVRISKTSAEQPYFSPAFKTDADEMRPECLTEPYNTYCRFFVGDAWYNVHYQSLTTSPPGPDLKDMTRDIPALFDGFKTNTGR